MPTRLLDRSTSLTVALYFATGGESTDDGVLYYQIATPQQTINPDSLKEENIWNFSDSLGQLVQMESPEKIKTWFDGKYKNVPIKDSFLYRPKQLHDRLKCQHGLFTVSIGKMVNNSHSSNRAFTELISPNISCLENEDLITKFVKKIDVYWTKYSNERGLLPETNEFLHAPVQGNTVQKNAASILMMVNKSTREIAIHIVALNITIYPNATFERIEDISDTPSLKKEETPKVAPSLILTALRNSNPVTVTQIFKYIKGTIRSELTKDDLSPRHVWKIHIPSKQKPILRKHLSIMGISHSTLFPEPSDFFQGLTERFYKL